MNAVAKPQDLSWPDLVWSHFSRPRFDDFDARVRAAAAAGYSGIGLYAQAFGRMRDAGRSAKELAALVVDHGLVLAEVETARGWWQNEGVHADECAMVEDLAYELADAAGVRYLQVIGPYECSFNQAVHQFGQLCDRAAAHGLLVGIEWLPYTNIANAAEAQAIVEAVGRSNAGYCADIWHHERGANDLAMIRALDPSKIFAVQMNDGPSTRVHDDYKTDCLASRLPPGEGTFNSTGFLRTLRDMGVNAPFSLEVCSHALWEGPVESAARASAEAMRRLLEEVER
jgi:sugar phosphate isomerase/epimerase